MKEMQVE